MLCVEGAGQSHGFRPFHRQKAKLQQARAMQLDEVYLKLKTEVTVGRFLPVAEREHFQRGGQGETRDHFWVAHKSKYDIRHLEIKGIFMTCTRCTLHHNINSDSGVIVKYTFTLYIFCSYMSSFFFLSKNIIRGSETVL